MAQLPLSNVIVISVSQGSPGVGQFNTSNLGLFTDDAPNLATFGTLGYAQYLTPTQVGIDFGTASKTYAMASAVFAQQPNILTGGGQLVIILLQTAIQTLAFSAAPASGAFVINYNGNPSASIAYNDTATVIQGKLQAVTGMSQVVVGGSIASQSLTIQFYGVYGAAVLVTITSNTLNGSITITPSTTTIGETLAASITRTSSLVQYFGIIVNESCGTGQVISAANVSAAAAVVQALTKMLIIVTNSSTDLTATTGMVAVNTAATNTQTRILYYGDTTALGVGVANALNMSAAYAGLGLSVNFNGSNTTSNLHLKPLSTISPDPSMTQTILNLAVAAGADTYISLQGVSAIFCSGANSFWDQVYNQLWFSSALQVAGFNYLAQSNTKIPQTEAGMDGLKGAYRAVCQQAVTNQYLAPGSWNSSTVFGNPANLIANIAQVGYYIYSSPIATQLQTARAARQAPLIQIAAKQAGAIDSSTCVIVINQ